MREIDRIVLHHSGRGVFGMLEFPIFTNLMHKNKYHFLVERDGKVYNGRPIEIPGEHTDAYDPHSVGICLIGNLNKRVPTEKQNRVLINLVSGICQEFHLSPSDIYGHRELEQTICPGRNVNLDEIRGQVEETLFVDSLPVIF